MSDIAEIFGRLEGRAFLKYKGEYYQIKEVEMTRQVGEIQEQIIVCREIGSEKLSKFKMKGEELLEPFLGVVEAERATGCAQILLLDLDSGEWRAYPITEDLRRRFPFLRDERSYIV